MKRTIAQAGLAVAPLLLLGTPPAESQGTATLAIVGGSVIDGYGGEPLRNAVVLVQGDRIVAVGPIGVVDVPSGAQIVDANGMTIMPGLWESHGHLWHVGEGDPAMLPRDFAGREIEVMTSTAQTNLLAGVTSFRDTGGPLKKQQELRAQIEAGEKVGPRMYFAGPIMNQITRSIGRTPGEYSVSTAEDARTTAERIIAMGVDQIKVYGFWDRPVLEAVTDAAHRAGIGVDADVRHIEAYRTAVHAGVDRMHHVFTADALSDYSDADLRLLVRGAKPVALGPSANILRGPYIVPTIEMRNAYVRALNFPEAVDHPRLEKQFAPDIYAALVETWRNPSAIPWGIGAPERIKVAKRKLKRYIAAGGREQVVAGCDTGAPLNFHSPLAREIENLADAGLTNMEAIQAATFRPAQMQGVDDKLGTISVGKLADIIVVDGDPLFDISILQHRVSHVIKGGIVFVVDGELVDRASPGQTTSARAMN